MKNQITKTIVFARRYDSPPRIFGEAILPAIILSLIQPKTEKIASLQHTRPPSVRNDEVSKYLITKSLFFLKNALPNG